MKTANIMVEGTSDVNYFMLAAKLYHQKHGRLLIGDDLSVFAVGEGPNGGTDAICSKFQVLRGLMTSDGCDPQGKAIRAICLVDNDYAGRKLCSILVNAVGFKKYKDVFLLNRKFPMTTREPTQYANAIQQENARWAEIYCEIEDLLPKAFLDVYVAEHRGSLKHQPELLNGEHHYEFANHAKAGLLRFAEANAVLSDVDKLLHVLSALRFALGLSPDGIALTNE